MLWLLGSNYFIGNMKIVFISNIFPTPDNYKAASALSYHLLKYRPKDVEIISYSFNANQVPEKARSLIEKDLNIKTKLIESSRLIKWLFKLHLTFLKNLLPYPFGYYNRLSKHIIKQIKELSPDGIWINGDCLSVAMKQFESLPRVMTMPDCVPLYYHRLMGDNFLWKNWFLLMGNCDQYYKNVRMEREYPTGPHIFYHLVGEEDRNFFKRINPLAKAIFIRHPHYNYLPAKHINFSHSKIKILIAGQYNLYMKTAFDQLLPKLCNEKELTRQYSITFLGRGWNQAVKQLQHAGYESNSIEYVDIYLEEIIKYDIQLTPISVGTGTKGKVLDALANGLLVIGTPYALENLAVEDGKSCLCYKEPEDLAHLLKTIPSDREHFQAIAEAGRKAVLKFHNREKVASELFSLFDQLQKVEPSK